MGKRLALLVGISRFDDRGIHALNAPLADVRALDAVLRDPDMGAFDGVDLCLDEPYESVRNKISLLTRSREADDLILFYYSGHGLLEFPAELHLLTRNTMLDNLDAASFRAEDIKSFFSRSRSRRQILILDCCYAGAYAAESKAVGTQPAVTQDTFDPEGFGRVIMLATSEAQAAPDAPAGSGSTSPYTRMIVEALRGGLVPEPGEVLSAQALAAYVEMRARREGLNIEPRHIVDSRAGPLVMMPRPGRGAATVRATPEAVNDRGPTPSGAHQAAQKPAQQPTATAIELGGPAGKSTNATGIVDRVGSAAPAMQAPVKSNAPSEPGPVSMSEAAEAVAEDRQTRTVGSKRVVLAIGVLALGGSALAAVLFFGPQKLTPSITPMPAASGYPVGSGQSFRECPDCPEMMVIPDGRFIMGSPASDDAGEPTERPVREVTVRAPFAIGQYHVTVGEYRAFVSATSRDAPASCAAHNAEGSQPQRAGLHWRQPGFHGYTQTDRDPAVCISWLDAQDYAKWLNERLRLPPDTYRLPTEAEWEYAARARTTSRFWWGSDASAQCRFANGADYSLRARIPGTDHWRVSPCDDGFPYTNPVGQFEANGFGIFDMGGNSWQWVQDAWRDDYVGALSDASVPIAGTSSSSRVLRGGSWRNVPQPLRSASRQRESPNYRNNTIGFRLARSPGA